MDDTVGLEMKLQFLEEVHGIMENGGQYTFQNGGQFQNIHLILIALFTVKLELCSSMSVAIRYFGFLEYGEEN